MLRLKSQLQAHETFENSKCLTRDAAFLHPRLRMHEPSSEKDANRIGFYSQILMLQLNSYMHFLLHFYRTVECVCNEEIVNHAPITQTSCPVLPSPQKKPE